MTTLGKATYKDIMSWDVRHLEGTHKERSPRLSNLVESEDAVGDALSSLVYGEEYSATVSSLVSVFVSSYSYVYRLGTLG